jgi:hypothetical protein
MRDVLAGVTRFDDLARDLGISRKVLCGHDTTPVSACAHCGDPLTVDNTAQLPGPGGRTGPGTRVLGPLLASRAGL